MAPRNQDKAIKDVLAEAQGMTPEATRAHVQAHYIALLKQQPRDSISIEMDIAFGPHERHRLDVHVPKAKSAGLRPVVMFVFGGGFVQGHKNLHGEWIYGNVPNFFARNDIIGVNVNYRLAPEHQWPAGAEDVARAVAWAHQNIAMAAIPTRYSSWGIRRARHMSQRTHSGRNCTRPAGPASPA